MFSSAHNSLFRNVMLDCQIVSPLKWTKNLQSASIFDSSFASRNIQKISPEGAIDHRQWCSEAKPLHTYQPINESPEGAKERLQLCVIVLSPLRG